MTLLVIVIVVAAISTWLLMRRDRDSGDEVALARHERAIDVLGQIVREQQSQHGDAAPPAERAAPGVASIPSTPQAKPPPVAPLTNQRPRHRHRWRAAMAAGALVAIAVAAAILATRGSGSSRRAQPPAATASTTVSTTTTVAAVAPPATVPVVATAPDGSLTVATTPPLTVRVTATENCWVEARAASGTLFAGELHSGETQVIPSFVAMSLTLGNVPGVAVALDDHPLDLTSAPQTATIKFGAGAP